MSCFLQHNSKISKKGLFGFRWKSKRRLKYTGKSLYWLQEGSRGIYMFDFTGQHIVDYPSKESRKYLATSKVKFKSDNKWSKEGTFLDSYSQVQLRRNGRCQRKPCHQDSAIKFFDTSCHSFFSAFLCIFSIPRRPVFYLLFFYLLCWYFPKQNMACSFMISTHVASPLSKGWPMPWSRYYNGIFWGNFTTYLVVCLL